MLGAGVLCAIVAVVMDGKAYGQLPSGGRAVSRKSIVICIVSGVLMGLWSPFSTHAMTQGNGWDLIAWRFFLRWGAAFLLHLEYLFHAASAGGRARGFRWIFPCAI